MTTTTVLNPDMPPGTLTIIGIDGLVSFLTPIDGVVELLGPPWSGVLDFGFDRLSRITFGATIHGLIAFVYLELPMEWHRRR